MKLYALIGFPLGHSFSKAYFTHKFMAEAITDRHFENFPLKNINAVRDMLRENPELCGFNVTIPYKQEIIPMLDAIEPQAAEIGAVNCVRVSDGRLSGTNTDAYGFERSLIETIGTARPSALVLGTGGASKAVCYVLRKLGVNYMRVSRTGGDITYAELSSEAVAKHHLIINCTPLGTYPNTENAPDIDYQAITSAHTLFDLVYNPPMTRFLRNGQTKGATLKNGYSMLVYQAEAGYEFWNSNEN